MSEKLDPETQRIADEGDALRQLSELPGWDFLRERLWKKIDDMQSVMNISGNDPEAVIRDIMVRQTVVSELKDFWQDVNGTIEAYKGNFSEEKSETSSHVIRT